MKCFLCDLENNNNKELKNHVIHFHLIDKDNYFLKDLFTKDIENKYSGRFKECKKDFGSCRKRNKCKVNVHHSMERINYQSVEETDHIIDLESRRSWLTDVCSYVYFNGYVQEEIRKNFVKRVIINGMTGSSWQLKRFERLSIVVTSNTDTTILF